MPICIPRAIGNVAQGVYIERGVRGSANDLSFAARRHKGVRQEVRELIDFQLLDVFHRQWRRLTP
jgi:hypothetical protein